MKGIGIDYSIVEAKNAVVSALDHGFLYGIGLFETFRTYDGQPFLLDRHLVRMTDGCRELGIRLDLDVERLRGWINRLMEFNSLEEAYIRYTVSAGEELLGLPQGDYKQPKELLYIKSLPPQPPSLYSNGRVLQVLRQRRNTPEGSVRFKSLHYMNNILAKRELSGYPSAAAGAEGLMLTEDGSIAEGIVSNVFWVQNGVLYTADLTTGILPGITREMVLELAKANGIAVEEGRFGIRRLETADEIFLTNSVQELVPVTVLWRDSESGVVSSGSCGPITAKLMALYRERTAAQA